MLLQIRYGLLPYYGDTRTIGPDKGRLMLVAIAELTLYYDEWYDVERENMIPDIKNSSSEGEIFLKGICMFALDC